MQTFNIKAVKKSLDPIWPELEAEAQKTLHLHHIANDAVIYLAKLEKGMESGADSVMLYSTDGNVKTVLELKLDTLEQVVNILKLLPYGESKKL